MWPLSSSVSPQRMEDLVATYLSLSPGRQKVVQMALLEHALQAFEGAYPRHGRTEYFESVCGTRQQFDHSLPSDAIWCITVSKDVANAGARFGEPICAMQERDIELPERLAFAYYSIYNAFRLHVGAEPIDPWLVVNQALAVYPEQEMAGALARAIDEASG